MNQSLEVPYIYRIEIEGHLDPKWAAWLSEAIIRMDTISDNDGGTMMVVSVPDQAGLRGLLNRIWDLNLRLLSVAYLAGYETTWGTHESSATMADS